MKNKKTQWIIISSVIVLIIVLVVAKLWKKNETPNNEEKQIIEISLDENLMITSIESYDGAFVEDGSNEEVEDILSITVKNVGQNTLQYAEATLIFDDVTAEFSFSTLRPNESMVVLEKNRLKYPNEKELSQHEIKNVIYFPQEPDMCSDKLIISTMDEAFNMKNIADKDLSGNIAIYYKNKFEQGYLGGITYRVVIEGGMKKDEMKQIVAKHFSVDNSQIIFVEHKETE